MRIISQDKEFELPYEETAIRAFDNGTVAAFSLTDLESNDFIIMAKYSTKEKAIKAMEACRKQYMDGEYNRNSLSGVAESIGRLSEGLASVFKEGVCQTFVFKFPADEEVQEYGK